MSSRPVNVSIKNISLIEVKILLPVFAFTVPLLFSGPQWITGTIVNCLLFTASERLTKKELYPVLILPSLGAIVHGVLFGPQTIFLYYFLPFIWLGNLLLVSVFSRTKSQTYFIRITLSAILKYLLLQFFAQLYFQAAVVPKLFVSTMGYIQLVTALAGGILSYVVLRYLNSHERN